MTVALYARYSSDNQRGASIADQLRECRTYADRQGWSVVQEYTDHAISGASLLRPGVQALLSDSGAGRYDIVLTEALDRLSRDQEDIAAVFKRLPASVAPAQCAWVSGKSLRPIKRSMSSRGTTWSTITWMTTPAFCRRPQADH